MYHIRLDIKQSSNDSDMTDDTNPPKNGIIGGGEDQKFRFTVLADGLLRLEWAPDGVFEDRPSSFAARRGQGEIPEFEVREADDRLEIVTSRFHLTYNKQEFSPHGLYAVVLNHTRHPWRYREPNDSNLGGTYRTLDNIDGRRDLEHGGEEIKLEPGVNSSKGFSLIDDSKSMLFTDDGFVAPRRPGPDRIDCYLFTYGHDYRDAVKALYKISGPTPLLPRWTFGNWWSRYYAYSADTYISLMDRFREEGIPLSVAVVDMDWHLVDDPRVREAGQTGWTGYTWNKDLFPDPPAFLNELHKRGLKTSLNDHPADGVASYEDKYREVAEAVGHDTSKKEPVPFNCVSPAYLKAYFDILLGALEKDGCDFWWIDWQQGPYSWIKDIDPLWVLNHFHFQHHRQLGNKNPIIFSRYGGPGSHRYPVGFSGDTYTTWESLDFQPEFTATASNIGYGWWSHDIGGHMLGVKDDDLTTRWVQFGVFSPMMRLHSTSSRWVTKEAWKLPAEPRAAITNFLRLRHRMIPYLQTMNVRAAGQPPARPGLGEGEPLVQPMYWEYPERDEAYQFKNQYLFGTELLVVPITTPLDTQLKLSKVKAWLPPGTYVDWFSGVVYEGDREMWLSRQLEQYPVFLKQGSIVPLDMASEPENGGANPKGFAVAVAVGDDGHFDILEDPDDSDDAHQSSSSSTQKNKWDCIPIKYTQATGQVQIGPLQPADSTTTGRHDRTWALRFVGLNEPENIKVTVDGATVYHTTLPVSNGTLIGIGKVAAGATAIIDIGKNPRLRRNDPLRLIDPVVHEAQISYGTKDEVWAVVTDERASVAARVSRLQTLDMNPNLLVFLTECLTAQTS